VRGINRNVTLLQQFLPAIRKARTKVLPHLNRVATLRCDATLTCFGLLLFLTLIFQFHKVA